MSTKGVLVPSARMTTPVVKHGTCNGETTTSTEVKQQNTTGVQMRQAVPPRPIPTIKDVSQRFPLLFYVNMCMCLRVHELKCAMRYTQHHLPLPQLILSCDHTQRHKHTLAHLGGETILKCVWCIKVHNAEIVLKVLQICIRAVMFAHADEAWEWLPSHSNCKYLNITLISNFLVSVSFPPLLNFPISILHLTFPCLFFVC